jgi:trans-aconitate methyltransferase
MTLYGEDYAKYQLERGGVRKLVRRAYLDAARRRLHGPTVDFGCGVGELLRRLPQGSVGLEINPVSVAHCQGVGLDARLYDADADDWSLRVLEPSAKLESLVVSHVLEHLDGPMEKLRKLLFASRRLGIRRLLVIVPGRRGYASDATHRTFVDLAMLSDPSVVEGTGFSLADGRYFPGNARWIGDFFPHHELQVAFERATP